MEGWWPPRLSKLQSLGGGCWASKGTSEIYREAGRSRRHLRGKLRQMQSGTGAINRAHLVERTTPESRPGGGGGRFSGAHGQAVLPSCQAPGLVSEVTGHRPPASTQTCTSTHTQGKGVTTKTECPHVCLDGVEIICPPTARQGGRAFPPPVDAEADQLLIRGE